MEYFGRRWGNCQLSVCLLIALVTNVTVMASKSQCYDQNGKPVSDGDHFVPSDDPCMRCKCNNGFMIMCQAVACHPPDTNCINWKKTEGECCEYVCLDPPGMNPDLPGYDNSTIGNGIEDDSITNLGLRLVASTVTSFLVLALLLFMVHRLRQRRLLLAMRRFEAQARRQQLEESESDQYIPETYLGMIECPPYEDPPPPYSSPKPPPRILPGEAPPPYEEVDQNRNSNNNNNSVHVQQSEGQTQASRGQGQVTSQEQIGGQGETSGVQIGGEGQTVVQGQRSGQGQVTEDHENAEASDRHPLDRSDIEQDLSKGSPSQSGRVRSGSPHCSVNIQNESIEGSELSHHNSLGRVSLSTDSTESHNCSCDSEQTLLKKTLSGGNVSGRSSQTLPAGFCLGQDRSRGRRGKSSNSKTSQGQSNPGAEFSWSPANSSQSLPFQSNTQNTSPKFSSLPVRYELVNETSNPSQDSTVSCGAIGFDHPLASENLNSTRGPGTTLTQSCVTLRDHENRSDQVQLRKSLPPLEFPASDDVDESRTKQPEQATGGHSSSHEYLRNIRLSNLLNSPNTAFDSPMSPVSPLVKPMPRSHSVTSDISIFSVCSETGEKRSKGQMGRVLRNDSQYPDIPISAHAMRMAALAHQTEGQGQCVLDGAAANENSDGHNGKNPYNESPKSNRYNESSSDRAFRSRPDCPDPVPLNSIPELQASQIYNPDQASASPKSHRPKKKDKHRQNRHSTGSILQCKPKKLSGQYELASNDPTEVETGSPVHSKKIHDKPSGSPVNKKSASPSKSHGVKGDSKKKPSKPVCDSYKQYGFIDEPAVLQTRNGGVELRVLNDEGDTLSPKGVRRSGTQTEKSVLGCDTKDQGVFRHDRKRHLTNYDKSTHSPSPTRQKSSRPRSIAHPPENGEMPLTCESLATNQSSPKRRSRNNVRSKKRTSYPITGPDSCPNPEYEDQPVGEEPTNQHTGQGSHPVGRITVRNGPLSSYV